VEVGLMSDSHSEGIQATPDHSSSHAIQTGHDHSMPDNPFTDAEIARFQREDRYAGGTVVVLMGTIFSIGVVLYTIVLLCIVI
jgi:hypothetical protein